MKTSHRFLLNQLCNLSLFIGLGCFAPKVFSKETVPGIIESLEKLQNLNSDLYKKAKEKYNTTPFTEDDLKNVTEIKLESSFLRSILFQSDNKLFSLFKKDECKFYALLELDMLKIADGDFSTLQVILKRKDGTETTGIISKNLFFDEFYKRKCTNNREFKVLFNEQNYFKTINGIKFPVPKGENDCKSIHNEWLLNSYTPYLCKINQTIKAAKLINKENIKQDQIGLKKVGQTYEDKLTLLQKNYLENLCTNLTNPVDFCEDYLKADIWNKVLNGEAPQYKLNYKCANVLNKEGIPTLAEQKKCAQKFITDPKYCITNGNKDFLSHFPLQTCDNISIALNHSKLNTQYHDCPGNVDNEAITNIHRIINHFIPRKIDSDPEACSGEANYSFARLNLDIKYEKGWPLQICYLNRVENKENCTPYIPGSRDDEPLSEDQVIAKILYLQKGAPAKNKCRIISSKKYNPLRSEFKNGCFIVFDAESCTTLSCTKKVYWEEKVQTDIRFIGTPIFEYYPSTFSNERYSAQNLLSEVRGIQNRSIRNLNDLKFWIDKINNGIIHGVACAEDIIPDVYQRQVINQCRPIPFIVDGYVVKGGETFLTTRTAIDDLFTPRMIQWNYIFNAVANYQSLNPLNTWTMNGLKK